MYVKGVGPQRAKHLEGKGLLTAGDLLTYAPFRYEDRSNVKPLDALAPGEMATVLATVRSAHSPRFQRRNLRLLEIVFTDERGSRLVGKWFHASWLEKVLEPGVRVALYGKVDFDTYAREITMLHPNSRSCAGVRTRGTIRCTRANCAGLRSRGEGEYTGVPHDSKGVAGPAAGVERCAARIPAEAAEAARAGSSATGTAFSSCRVGRAGAECLPVTGTGPADLRGVFLARNGDGPAPGAGAGGARDRVQSDRPGAAAGP
jgi:hypothetical protein